MDKEPGKIPMTPEEIRKGLKRSLYIALVIAAVFLGPLFIKTCVGRFTGG